MASKLYKVKKKTVETDDKKKKMVAPKGGFKGAKISYEDIKGNKHTTVVGMRRANKRLKGNTQPGDYNPRTNSKQK